jgi:hypothetical protein
MSIGNAEPTANNISNVISPMKNFLLTICAGLPLITSMAHASAGEVWFAPSDNLDRGPRTFNHDFTQLFEPSPAWDGKTDVFVLSPKFAEEAPEETTKHVTSWLAAHHNHRTNPATSRLEAPGDLARPSISQIRLSAGTRIPRLAPRACLLVPKAAERGRSS